MSVTAVLFWDIDGTLLTTARAGIYAWQDATSELVGAHVDVVGMRTAGKTDVEIAAEILRMHGADATRPSVERLVRRYEALLPDRLWRREGRVLPGVKEILVALQTRPDVLSLLLTGNTRAGAAAKLRHYGLGQYFDGGAFAEDADDRAGVARRALRLARERLQGRIPDEAIYVIGDTPADVHCGQAIGARTVAVASGEYGAADLAAAGAWLVLPGLPSPEAWLIALGIDAA